MKSKEEIEIRIREVEQRIRKIDDAISKELQRPFFFRRPNLCQLLDLQKKIQAAIWNELKWMLYE